MNLINCLTRQLFFLLPIIHRAEGNSLWVSPWSTPSTWMHESHCGHCQRLLTIFGAIEKHSSEVVAVLSVLHIWWWQPPWILFFTTIWEQISSVVCVTIVIRCFVCSFCLQACHHVPRCCISQRVSCQCVEMFGTLEHSSSECFNYSIIVVIKPSMKEWGEHKGRNGEVDIFKTISRWRRLVSFCSNWNVSFAALTLLWLLLLQYGDGDTQVDSTLSCFTLVVVVNTSGGVVRVTIINIMMPMVWRRRWWWFWAYQITLAHLHCWKKERPLSLSHEYLNQLWANYSFCLSYCLFISMWTQKGFAPIATTAQVFCGR